MSVFARQGLYALVAVLFSLVNASKLDIKNGGFEDFVTAVNKDVPYTPDIVCQLQTLIQAKSDRLYETTRLFVRTASILVPSTWPRERTWEKTDKLTFVEADLRVDKPHPYYRNRPYTQPTWQCGQKQNYIHITPDFVRDSGSKHRSQSEGIHLANQFASYRWGVFEDIIKDNKDGESMSKTQEKVCNGRPAWDVIKSHPDYKQSGQTRKPISFRVLYNENDISKAPDEKECGRPVVLVLDFSGSMDGDRAFRQQQAGTKFIKEILPLSTELGMIAFATSPKRLVASLVKLTGDDVKDRLASKIGTSEGGIGGSTDIGAALEAAKQMLVESGHPLEECRIILLTDGEENPKHQIARVKPDLVASKIKVHSIAVGDQAAADLGILCQETGGQLGKYVESKDSSSLTQAVDNLWSDFNMLCVENKPIEIENRALLLGKDHPEIEESVAIPTSIKDAEFTFTPERGNIEVTVTGPDQTTYDDKSPEYREEKRTHVIKFTFKNMEPGEWKSKVVSKSVTSASSGDKKEQVIMNVKAKAKEEIQSYEVRSWLNSVIVEIPAVTRIYAEVTQGYAPLIKAKVTASIEVPGEGTITVELKDDGKWPDVRALDGTYTAEFQHSPTEHLKKSASESPSSERYSVDITVTPVKGQTSVVHKLAKEECLKDEKFPKNVFDVEITEEDIVADPVEPFHRKTSPGAFEIKNVTYGADLYPPARVVDLGMTGLKDNTITLEWTAPGDDMGNGTAAGYEFRFWHNDTELRKNLTTGILLTQDSIVEGTMAPSPSGSKEVLKFNLPEYWPTSYVFIAMVSRDDASHQSEVSNIVKVLHPGPVYSILSDHYSLFVYAYATVYFITRLVEVTTVRP